jgi:15-cis-phytoene synthase
MSVESETFATAAEDHSSRSNLALAFLVLPKEKRHDMDVFYTFCRVVDDIADSTSLPAETKRQHLEAWKQNLTSEAGAPQPHALGRQIRALMEKYRLKADQFLAIIAGVEMDLAPARYETWEQLRLYCHRVASAVGLVSIEIFGYQHADTRRYAVDLGLALQITNIIRDVAKDYANGGRIYLPRDEMAKFGVTVAQIAEGREDAAFRALLDFEAGRAESFYQSAVAALPAVDRRSMVAAEIMRAVYHRLLERMQGEGFHVLTKSYRLSRLAKMWVVAREGLRNRFAGTAKPRA